MGLGASELAGAYVTCQSERDPARAPRLYTFENASAARAPCLGCLREARRPEGRS